MAFDSTKFKAKQGKFLPVLLMLDRSSSMTGEKIDTLNRATQEMIADFATVPSEDVEIMIGILAFSSTVSLHIPFQRAKEVAKRGWTPLIASGNTAFGACLGKGQELLEDSSQLPKNIYRPAVVVVSDGQPTDDWKSPLQQFITEGRSAKCQRFAIAIGDDVNINALETFTGEPDKVLMAKDTQALKKQFAFITQTLSQRSVSVNPNQVSASKSANSLPSQAPEEEKSLPLDDFFDDYDPDSL